ncbi:MAG: phosphorybosylanthranilate isomerase, partial [Gemmatimonadetes bacterium]|nr:phosphorybosylanthranilate isomerase [Gemmatimonadota bacterium]NIQ52791.1 phosphorybosylanthranilate isomerase [Gemmatimonadota bacterium]NIU72921.1 phosphorybosylanthranilate isomerase [Gammaproteobacteria bacterium]NIX43281.1 phosphorybosylanthranilate isomerase [Gemmatimonadota bacterium]NIY07458.1 phosphorybosylanthranilate isomerase [Gemmatimonadota bacterium]
AARDAWERGLADGLIVSGAATGAPASLDDVRRVRDALPEAPVLVGSGVTAETVRAALDVAHGVIVGSALEEGGVAGRPVDAGRVRRLMDAARS